MRRTRYPLAAAVAAATTAGLLAVPAAAQAAPKPPVPVQLLAMNDFHGRITPPSGADGALATSPGPDNVYGNTDDVTVPVGGAQHVAATVEALQAQFAQQNGGSADSFFVGAGDLISASPFESSVYKDEPTIEALNAMGLDVSSVGNHEFDRGTEELRRISAATDGTYTDDVTACEGIEPGVDGCFGTGEHAFEGAQFPYLAANVVSRETGEPMLPPYQVFDVAGGQQVALIGVVTETTPTIVSPDGVADVEFIDEADAVNRWTKELKKQGIRAVGVLVHEGGSVSDPNAAATANNCTDLTGPIVDINARIDKDVDFIVSAHTHQAYNCLLPVRGSQPRLVTQAGFYGRLVTDIRLTLNPNTGDVDRRATYAATNVPVTRTAADPEVQAIVDYWNARAAETRNVVVGEAAATIGTAGSAGRNAEQPIVNLVAQAQLEAMQQDQFGNPVIAFMNPGGVRTNIEAGEVTFGELFNVQPFGNTVNAITLTGAQIDDVLEEQFQLNGGPRNSQLILGTSEGFAYTYDLDLPYGDRVVDTSITLDGVTIDPAASYRVVANSFLTAGGDSFTTFAGGTGLTVGPVDVDTLVAYFEANSPVSPPPANHGTAI
ncbi:5'-nucleotidase [Geodermatophilus saharensis]|uniref:5'-nucleotidase n=1 Tax=Geodermatophilus saharensis TaxID=1137994 RepID=A0A239AC33_9ACTN|nr:bifunctional metallophosphatase/5'-nucleotidase [Geodermatophilus saharensis]SNR93187.1 5'-nucleotidase [Geodermatophilus saharensis]